jgi:Raf kinase inhibitor-like YbhB/YbcL family protein
MRKFFLLILFILFIGSITVFVLLFNSHKIITQNLSTQAKPSVTIIIAKSRAMMITSSAFENNGIIPSRYTCDGQSINPPLEFSDVPSTTKSLVMLMDDPDVPKNLLPAGVFDHWVLYNIPPTVREIGENSIPSGVSQGLNGTGQQKYTGPCPPDREHRYFFKLFALDTRLEFSVPSKVTKQLVIGAIKGHIIEQAELIGHYNRPQNK